MREDINTFAQRKEHALSNMAIVVLLSHGEDGLVFGTGEYGTAVVLGDKIVILIRVLI